MNEFKSLSPGEEVYETYELSRVKPELQSLLNDHFQLSPGWVFNIKYATESILVQGH